MKNNKKGFSAAEILIVVVIVGLVGAVGWLVYDRQQDQSDNSQINASTRQQTTTRPQSTTNRETPKDWKKYSNEKYGFSFYLPANWQLHETDHSPADSAVNQLFSVSFAPPDSVHDFMMVEVLAMSLSEMLENEWFQKANIFDPRSSDRKDIILNGYKGYQYTTYDDTDYSYYFYEVGNKLILFEDNFGGDYHEQESQQIFESFRIN